MADDDIQLNFGTFAPPKPRPEIKREPKPAVRPEKPINPKKRDRSTSQTNLNDIRTGVWQKQDIQVQKAKLKAAIESKPLSSSGPSITSDEPSNNKNNDESTSPTKQDKIQVDDKPNEQEKDDLKSFEPANKKPKLLTSKQKLKNQESEYAQYVKNQKNENIKNNSENKKQDKNTQKSKSVHYQTVSELGHEYDIFSDKSFEDLELDKYLVDNLQNYMSMSKPTQIQRFSIPVLISRRDALIKAQTGSGKTLSYLIPVVQDLIAHARKNPAPISTIQKKDRKQKQNQQVSAESSEDDLRDDSDKDDDLRDDSDHDMSEDDMSNHDNDDNDNINSKEDDENTSFKSKRVLKYKLNLNQKDDEEDDEDDDNDDGDKSKSKPKKAKSDHDGLMIDRSTGTHAIVIAPTRELSLQIYEVLRKLLRPYPQIVPGVIMGGEKRKSEKARLRKGVSILIATPGRLLDHLLHTQSFHFEKCRWLVLDEADRLLDMGFERDLTAIINALNQRQQFSRRQSVLASATLNRDVNRLALLSLTKPVYISLETPEKKEIDIDNDDVGDSNIPEDERVHELPASLKQHYVVVDDKRKLITLIAFLRNKLKQAGTKVIVFFSNCDSVDFYYMTLSMIEVGVTFQKGKDKDRERLIPASLFKLHGNLSQDVRSSTFQAFSSSSTGVLLCTDVAARGLDVPAVNWIVQYDVPSDPAAYVHRIGRTARIGSSGDALLLLFQSERPYLDVLNKRQMTLNEIPQSDILKTLKVYLEPNPSNDMLQEASSLQHKIEKLVESSKQVELKNMAINAFQAFIRSYATHTKSTKHIFHIKNLHLGHLCRNFALRDPPSSFGKTLQQSGLGKKEAQRVKERARDKEKKKLKIKPAGVVTADEFAM